MNLDNTLDAVISKGYEQYYIPRVNSLYVFISQQNGVYYPSLSLTTENSLFIQRYFTDERKKSCLYNVLNHKRIRTLALKPIAVKKSICIPLPMSLQEKFIITQPLAQSLSNKQN